jgi:tetratricopeptide (TPR) repeat protein
MAGTNEFATEGSPRGFTLCRAPGVGHEPRPFNAGARVRAALLGWLLALLLGSGSLFAGDKGMVTGTVAGASRIPIPGAKLTLAAADGSRQSATADQAGHYSFPSVEPGSYTLVAEAAGYQAATRAEVRVTGGTSTTVDLLLAAGPLRLNQASTTPQQPSFYDDTQLKASAVKSPVDAAGYSSQAQSPKRLLTEGPSLTGKAPAMQPQGPGSPKAAEVGPDLQKLQLAAQTDPSEENIFNLGNELLLQETIEPAIEVFKKGVALYPHSPRMYIGLGIALYSHSSYEAAIKALCHASDLDPSDPRAYVFLGRVYDFSASQADEVAKRMKRFMETNPDNALAYYYGALTLWKGIHSHDQVVDEAGVEALFRKAIGLDSRLADAHLQLGILYQDQHREQEAIQEFQAASRLNPDDPDAHYRLAQAYLRTGEKQRAQEELQLYEKLHNQQVNETEKHRLEIRLPVAPQGEPAKTNP